MSRWITGILGSLLTACVIGTFTWAWKLNVQLALLQDQVTRISADKRKDEDQDRSLHMLWRYGAWAEQQINRLCFRAGIEPPERPKFD